MWLSVQGKQEEKPPPGCLCFLYRFHEQALLATHRTAGFRHACDGCMYSTYSILPLHQLSASIYVQYIPFTDATADAGGAATTPSPISPTNITDHR